RGAARGLWHRGMPGRAGAAASRAGAGGAGQVPDHARLLARDARRPAPPPPRPAAVRSPRRGADGLSQGRFLIANPPYGDSNDRKPRLAGLTLDAPAGRPICYALSGIIP